MPSFCCVVKCGNTSAKFRKSFYRLPALLEHANYYKMHLSAERKKKWLMAIRRADLDDSNANKKHLRVCEDHFITGKPAELHDVDHPDWIPTKNMGYENIFQTSLHQKSYRICSVPFCFGHYLTGLIITLFSFPKDPEYKQKWLSAIHQEDFYPTENSKVCELHFKESDFETETSAYDPKTGKTLTAPLSVKRLKKNVVPSVNINPPKTSKSVPSRETPDQKRKRLEMNHLSHAVQDSLKSVPGENSLTENTSESRCGPDSSASRQTENCVETEKNKGLKRKRKLDKGEIPQKTVNGPSNANFAQGSSSQTIMPSCSDSDDFSLSLQDVQIKEEAPWEEEYGFARNSSSNIDRLKILSVQSHASSENVNPITSQQSTVSTADSCSSNENVEKSPEKESNSNQGCDSTFYKKPLKVDKRDEAFGRLVACEMSDLRVNPELYLKTQQSILKLLVEAHFEQISASNAS